MSQNRYTPGGLSVNITLNLLPVSLFIALWPVHRYRVLSLALPDPWIRSARADQGSGDPSMR